MSSINYLNFCGTESAGSVAKRKNKSEQTPPNTNVASNYYLRNDLESGDKVCFRGNDAYDGKKKKKSIAFGIASTILLAGGAIVGLGVAHGKGLLKGNEGWKKIFNNLEGVGKTCENWTNTVKDTVVGWYNKFIGLFKKKKD